MALARIRQTLSALADLYTYPLRLSHYAELVNPLWTSHQLQARIVGVWDETQDARTLTLKPGRHWRTHRAGQHVRVGVAVEGRQYSRTYSISSPPERRDGKFTITVKAIADGRLSQHLVRRARVGDYLPVGLPQGDFHLPDSTPVKPLFITAGSGITPVMSMLRSLIARKRLPDTVHLHFAPHARDMIFGAELSQMNHTQDNYTLHPLFTRENTPAAPGSAHLRPDLLERLCPDWRERDIYTCGPPALLAAIQAEVDVAGVGSHLHIERFLADFSPTPEEAVGGRVRFAQAGREIDADAATPLLRVAEDAGMNPPHGCRMGICHTCTTQLLSGCVRDLRDNTLINETGSRIQTCICAAAGDCEIDL